MMHPDSVSSTVHPRAHGAPAPQLRVMARPDRHEGLMAWSLMVGVLLVWFGLMPALVT